MTKRIPQIAVIFAIVVASLGSTGHVLASSSCASYITGQWGDTLSGIASLCDTTVEAIRAANPGLGWWLYAGQVLYIPTGSTNTGNQPNYGGTYVVRSGASLSKIAVRSGVTLSSLSAVNPQIWNPSLIYVGQVIYLPVGAGTLPYNPPPTPTPCDCPPSTPDDSLSTLRIDYKHGMYLRSEPNGKILSSALNHETVYYYPDSITYDGKWRAWVKVKLYPPVKGYYDGWLLVKDQFGTYFTDPPIE